MLRFFFVVLPEATLLYDSFELNGNQELEDFVMRKAVRFEKLKLKKMNPGYAAKLKLFRDVDNSKEVHRSLPI